MDPAPAGRGEQGTGSMAGSSDLERAEAALLRAAVAALHAWRQFARAEDRAKAVAKEVHDVEIEDVGIEGNLGVFDDWSIMDIEKSLARERAVEARERAEEARQRALETRARAEEAREAVENARRAVEAIRAREGNA